MPRSDSSGSLKTGNQAHKRCRENAKDQAADRVKSQSTAVGDEIQAEELSKGWSAKEVKRSVLRLQLQRLQAAKAEMPRRCSKSRGSARLSSAGVICALLPVSAPLLSSSQPYAIQVLPQAAAATARLNSTPQAQGAAKTYEPRIAEAHETVVVTVQMCTKSEGGRLGTVPDTPGVDTTSHGAPPRRCRTVITKHEAIQIFVAKHSHTTGDHQAARLGLEFGLTNKAIRDIWTMRTWALATKPYRNASDEEQFSRVVTRTTTKKKPTKEHDNRGWMIPPAVIAKEFELEAMLDSWHQTTSQEQFVSAASTEEFIVTLVLPFGHLG